MARIVLQDVGKYAFRGSSVFDKMQHELISNLEMVLFHCCFTAAKFRYPMTTSPLDSDEYVLGGEKKLFQGCVVYEVIGGPSSLTYVRRLVDDGFEHMLSVLQDNKCGGLRLLASAQNGELRNFPVWTAFSVSLCSIHLHVQKLC